MTFVRVENLCTSYGNRKVLNNISFDIKRGEIFGIIGQSGSGKTTLLHSLIDYCKHSGRVIFSPAARHAKHNRLSFFYGFSAQEPSFYHELTLHENLVFFASLYGIPTQQAEQRITSLLAMMNLTSHQYALAHELSGGMKKRFDIACALIHNPALLILDEPTSDLDPQLRKQMWELLKTINASGTTILLSSHFLDEVESLCNRVGLLHNNTIAHIGSPKQLLHTHKLPSVITFMTMQDSTYLFPHIKRIDPLVVFYVKQNYECRIQTTKPKDILDMLYVQTKKYNDEIVYLDIAHPCLDDLFAYLTNVQLSQVNVEKNMTQYRGDAS